jgi:hypothetical protein
MQQVLTHPFFFVPRHLGHFVAFNVVLLIEQVWLVFTFELLMIESNGCNISTHIAEAELVLSSISVCKFTSDSFQLRCNNEPTDSLHAFRQCDSKKHFGAYMLCIVNGNSGECTPQYDTDCCYLVSSICLVIDRRYCDVQSITNPDHITTIS